MLVPLSFLVEVGDGIVWRRHVDHLKPLLETSTGATSSSDLAQPDESTEEEVYFPFTDTTVDIDTDNPVDHSAGNEQNGRCARPPHCRERHTQLVIANDLPGTAVLYLIDFSMDTHMLHVVIINVWSTFHDCIHL